MSPTFSVNSSSQLLASANIDAGTSVYNSAQSSSCISLSSFILENGSNISLMPLYNDGTTISDISQGILDCIGKY
jgi:hypothetical protein